MSVFKKLFLRVRSYPWYWQVGGAVAVVAVGLLGLHAATRSTPSAAVVSGVSHVRVASVASLSSQNAGPLPVTGAVSSVNQAAILAQSTGEVVSLVRELGDYVPAGGVIAQLENSSQRAAVLQAQGAYDAAQASFVNSGISATGASQSVLNAQNSVDTAMQSLYSALDDAVHTKSDLLFADARTNPKLILTLPDSQLVITLQNERTGLDFTLADAASLAAKNPRAATDDDIKSMNADAHLVAVFLNNLVDAVNKAVPGDTVTAAEISAFQTSIGAARSEVTTGVSSLASAKSTYDAAVSSAATAGNTAGTGGRNSVSLAQAQVTQAQGALNAAQATLEKTIIRSPISGTIVSLPLTRGGFITANSQVAVVSNPGALEVTAYVTPDDAKTLAVGGSAILGTATKGVIVAIAPALDPTTGKIRVKVGIVGDPSALTDGDTVTVSLSRATAAQKPKSKTPSAILIPIVAAKITPGGPVAFRVSASSTLEALPITLGTILGDQVTVLSGLSLDTAIVTDARGLSAGQTVVVDAH